MKALNLCIFTFLLISLSGFPGNARAHISYPCLLDVARAAKSLKQCTAADHSDHCRDLRQRLSDQVRLCRQQAFTTEAIEEAIQEGEGKVEGDSSYYLPEKSEQDSASAEINVSKGNIQNFQSQFANITAFPVEDLDYGAGQGGCQNAFLAGAGRHQFLGHFEFKRYMIEDDLEPRPYRLYFFSRMEEGVCYAAPKPGQTMDNGDLLVLNLPTGFFDFLTRATRQAGPEAVIVRCGNEKECTEKKRKAVSLQVDYHGTYLRLKRMENCEEQEGEKHWFRRMAKFSTSKESLPRYCMEEHLEENLTHLKKTLAETAGQLFEKL